jgi:hypothetical protein
VHNLGVLRFLRLLFGHDCPSRREMMATRDACDALDQRVDNHYRELRELRGRVNAMRRWDKAAADEAAQSAPQSLQDAPGPHEVSRRVVGAPQIPRRNY